MNRVPSETSAVTRRQFVRTGGGVLLVVAIEACVSEGLRNERGTVRLTLTGLDPSASSGGRATITQAGHEPVVVDVPVGSQVVVTVDVGDYLLEYTPPDGYVLASGQQTESRNFSVTFGVETTITLLVVAEATVGAMTVNVSGLSGTNGGTAVLSRTDAPSAPRFLVVSGSGSASATSIPTGVYNVEYQPPPGFLDVSSVNPVPAVSVSSGGSVSVDFAVTPAPGAIAIAVSGLAGATSGGSASVVGIASGQSAGTLNLQPPTSGQTSGRVEGLTAGAYSITYTPPPGFELLTGGANPAAATVTAGGEVGVSFAVRQTPGAIRVTVSGLSGALGAGQVTAARSDKSGGTFSLNLPVPVNGTSTGDLTDLPPGAYDVQYSAPPAGFQLTTAAIVAATVTGGGTANAGFTVAATPGTLRLVVDGMSGASDSGSAQIQRTDVAGQSPTVLSVPAAGSVDVTLPPGTYSVTLTPPAGHLVAVTQTNPRTVSIIGSQTATVTFQVAPIPAPGTLRITVAGLVAGATTGGTAELVRTDVPNQSPAALSIPSSGSLDSALDAGAYRVTYSPPSGHTLAANQQNPRDISVTSGGTTTIAFAVREPIVGVIFMSDFRTAVGTSANAIGDGGKWQLIAGAGQEVIVAAAALAFPSANVLRITASAARQGFGLVRKSGMPAPSAPFIRNYRWYYRQASDIGGHPIQDGYAQSNTNWTFNPDPVDASTYRPNIGIGPSTPDGLSRWKINPPGLPANQTFRWELQYIALSATTCRVHLRVYDSANNLVLSDGDFWKTMGSQPQNNLGQNPVLNVNTLANMDGLNCGLNGAFFGTVDTLASYQGCFAVVDGLAEGTFIGPYGSVVGET